ncbi:M4 family metallopeptidase [Longispora albida]|uniref:M4 family metallopeptidase n=1 Tax=Longispora albida TaxID=203523 RepID=UPI0003701A7A|nr:M4 family metallopeptidase [Longispora albida]
MRRTIPAVTLAGILAVPPLALIASPAAAAPAQPALTGKAAATAAANRLVASGNARFKKSAYDQLSLVKVHEGTAGLQYAAFERTHKGLPVIGGDAVVVTDSTGRILHTANAQDHVITVGTTPAVTAPAALGTATQQLAAVKEASEPKLSVLAWGSPALVWDVVVTGRTQAGTPSRLHVLVDAATGGVARKYDDFAAGSGTGYYNGSQTIGTSGSAGSFQMSDPARPGLRCGGLDGATFTGTDDAWGNGSGTNLEAACVDAMYAGGKQWDMVGSWLGRNGLDGSGNGFAMRVGSSDVNAYWKYSYAEFGKSSDNLRQAVSVDLVGHELGHGIFQNTPGGSTAENGLNEGTGDIFGTMTEHYTADPAKPADYVMFEDFNYYGSGAIRNQADPSQYGDPNCWSAAIKTTEEHAAAGPLNHWFYLLAEGSNPGGGKPVSPICAGGPSSVTGVGMQAAGKIFYNGLLTKTSGWEYTDVRVATLAAAKNLYPGDCTTFNRVRDAWNAVSVPAGPEEPQCGTTDNFSVSVAPAGASVKADGMVFLWVTSAVTSGSTEILSLSASGLPAGTTGVFEAPTVTTGQPSQLTIDTAATTTPGTYPITITATGAQTHTTVFELSVLAPEADDYVIELENIPQFIVPGNSHDVTVKAVIQDTSSQPQSVTLSATGLPAGATATFTPETVMTGGIAWGPSTMHITTSPATPYGEYRITISGSGGVANHYTWFYLKVTPVPNDFSVSIGQASASIAAGASGNVTVSTALVSGAVPSISLKAQQPGMPAGTGFTFNPVTVAAGGSSALTIAIPAGATPGAYTLTVNADSPDKSHSASIPVTVTAGSTCGGYQVTATGTLSAGANAYKPGTSGFTAAAGTHQACLDGPAGKDFDLYLQKLSGGSWVTVASAASSSADESLTYTGTAGTYRYRIYAYSGSGSYTLGYNTP